MDCFELANVYNTLHELLLSHNGNNKWTEEDLIIAIELLKKFEELTVMLLSSKKVFGDE